MGRIADGLRSRAVSFFLLLPRREEEVDLGGGGGEDVFVPVTDVLGEEVLVVFAAVEMAGVELFKENLLAQAMFAEVMGEDGEGEVVSGGGGVAPVETTLRVVMRESLEFGEGAVALL